MNTNYSADIVVVGGGPAGLAAATALKHKGYSFYLLEAGKSLSNRIHSERGDLGKGIGGAGLFSDGKFSFFPSGSKLYKLRNQLVYEAYSWFKEITSTIDITLPDYPLNDPEMLLYELEKKSNIDLSTATLTKEKILFTY